MAASAYTDTVQKVYIAYYGRAADPVGLAYWSQAIDDAGGSLDAIMASFGTSAEATTLYGSLSNSAKVNAIYQQSFGRDADFAGLMYYSGQLSAGTMTASSIAQNIFDGATGTDATTLTNKLAVAKAYTTAVDAADEVVAYAGTVAADAARTLLGTVDSTTTVSGFDVDTSIAAMVTAANTTPETAAEKAAAAKVIADAAQVITDAAAAKVITDAAAAVVAANAAAAKVIADAKVLADAASAKAIVDAAAAKVISDAKVVTDAAAKVISDAAAAKVISDAADSTVALTATTDTLTGGSGANTFTSVLQANGATGTTVAPGDSVSGGDGIDTLNISVAGALTANDSYTLSAVSTNAVEKVLLSNFDTVTGGSTEETNIVDASLMTGLTTVGLSSSSATGDTEFTNLKNLVAGEMHNGDADLTLTYASSVVTGTADAQTLNISNVGAGTFTANATEDITINGSLVKSTLLDVVSSTLKSVTVTGDQDLAVTNAINFAATANGTAIDGTIDASALTGGLTALMGGASTVKLTGGTGTDVIDFAGLLTTNDVVDLGDGADTIKMDAATLSTQFTNVSNVETVSFNAAVAGVAMNAAKVSTGVTELTMDISDGTDGSSAKLASTVTNLSGQSVTIQHTVLDAADTDDSDGTKVTISNAVDTAADSVSVKLDAIGIDDQTGTNGGVDEVDVSNFETVNLTSSKSATVTANEVETLTASSATSVVVTGDADLEIGAVTGTSITSFDASALAGKLVLTAGAEKATYKMGTKDSTLTMGSNLNASDTIVGGAGTADSVTATVTGLTATTGALKISDVETVTLTTSGNNTLDLTGVTGATTIAVSANTQTITGFDLTDTIRATAAATVNVTATDATGAADTLLFEQKLNGSVANIIEADDVETLTITLNDTASTVNAATFDLDKFTGTTVNFTQAALSSTDVTVALVASTKLHKNVTTVDAAGMKSTVTLSAADATNAVTFSAQGAGVQDLTGGAKADTFNIGSTANIVHVVTGGAGTDTTNLTVASASALDVSTIATENLNLAVTAGVDATQTGTVNAATTAVTVTGGNSLSTLTTDDEGILGTVKTFDSSAFLGNVVVDIADNTVDSTVVITAGSASAKDEIQYQISATGTDALYSTGVEILDLNVDATATLNLTNATGVVTVDVDVATTETATISGLTGTENILVTAAATGTGVVEAILGDATGTTDSISFELDGATAGTIADGTALTTSDIETVTVKASSAESITLANLSMSTATDVMALNVTGANALTVTALGSQVTTIDASGMTTGGSFVQTGRSSTDAVTYTGSLGSDTFMMLNKGDVLDAGAGTADNLNVDFTGILGGIAVDLTSTTDQIGTMDGATNSAAQVGFESVDLSGYTGFGASVTGSKLANTIIGTTSTDSISGAAGDDVITGNGGADVITGGTGDDTIKFTGTTAVAVGSVDGGAGTDILEITDVGVVDFTSETISNIETLIVAADGGADIVKIKQGFFEAGAVTFTATSGIDTHNDVLNIKAGSTAWDALTEASAAAVDIAGEWHLENGGAANGVLTYYNQGESAVTTVTLTGLDLGAIAISTDLIWTA